MRTKLVVITLLLTIALTACSGKAGATSGKSSTATSSANESISQILSHQDQNADSSSSAASELDSSNSSSATASSEPVTEPAPTITGSVGTVDHSVAVDPAPYWQGDDFFDIEAYFYACGGTDYHVIIQDDTIIRAECTIGKYRLSVLSYPNGGIVLFEMPSRTPSVSLDPKDINEIGPATVSLDNNGLTGFKHDINLLLKIMPRVIAQEDDVFLGSGFYYSIGGVRYD